MVSPTKSSPSFNSNQLGRLRLFAAVVVGAVVLALLAGGASRVGAREYAPADGEYAPANGLSEHGAGPTDLDGLSQPSLAYRLVDTWGDVTDAHRVVAGVNGDIHVARQEGVERRSTEGAVVGLTPVGPVYELAVDASGSVYGTTGSYRDGQTSSPSSAVFKAAGGGSVVWTENLPGFYILGYNIERPPYVTGLTWDPSSRSVLALYDFGGANGGSLFYIRPYTMGGSAMPDFRPIGSDATYWDAAARDGRVYMLNRTQSTVEIYQGQAHIGTIGLAEPGERLEVGPDGSVYVISRRRWVYRYDQRGDVTAVWDALDPEPALGPDSQALDVAVDASGRVYVADPNRNQVRVYDLDPDPEAEPPPPPEPPSIACQMVPDKFAEPTRMRLGGQTQVTLRLDGNCPEVSDRADIVLVVDRSGSMQHDGKLDRAKEAVEDFVYSMNLDRDQIGLVSFESSATRMVGLTDSGAQVVGAVRTLTPDGGTDIAAAIDAALDELSSGNRRVDAKPIVILLTDGKPFNVTGAATLAAADRSRYLQAPAGCRAYNTCSVNMYTVGLGTDVDQGLLRIVASNPNLYFYAPNPDQLQAVYENIARRISAEFLLKTVSIVDHIPDNMTYVADSAVPVAAYDEVAHTLTWTFDSVPFAGTQMTYWLEPEEVGTWPTNIVAIYDGEDGLDNEQIGEFPIPQVIVYDDTPTPPPSPTPTATATTPPTETSSPTLTPSPTATDTATDVPPTITPTPTLSTATPTATLPPDTATPTSSPEPSPTATPGRYSIYIIIAFNNECFKRYTDVALVIDASTTMLRKSERGIPKIQEAQAAARTFVDQLQLTPDHQGRHDQASIVWFNDSAAVEQGLTNDRGQLMAAIDRLSPVEGSKIDLGLEAGREALFDASRHVTANTPVLILLSDGIPNRTTYENIYGAADAAKLAGARVISVGHGLDAIEGVLRRVASDPDSYHYSPTGADLGRIYREIAGDVICR